MTKRGQIASTKKHPKTVNHPIECARPQVFSTFLSKDATFDGVDGFDGVEGLLLGLREYGELTGSFLTGIYLLFLNTNSDCFNSMNASSY